MTKEEANTKILEAYENSDTGRADYRVIYIILNDIYKDFDKALNAMQEFVDRVDKHEIRSKYTYNKFKSILKDMK